MSEFILYAHADQLEGIVRTLKWRYCKTDDCLHWSHPNNFKYHATYIRGVQLWEGDYGERLVVSEKTGRVFITKCEYQERRGPEMYTYEIINKEIPPYPRRQLEARYGSWRHEKLQELLKAIDEAAEWRKKVEEVKREHGLIA
jgi:hypothetical protein